MARTNRGAVGRRSGLLKSSSIPWTNVCLAKLTRSVDKRLEKELSGIEGKKEVDSDQIQTGSFPSSTHTSSEYYLVVFS